MLFQHPHQPWSLHFFQFHVLLLRSFTLSPPSQKGNNTTSQTCTCKPSGKWDFAREALAVRACRACSRRRVHGAGSYWLSLVVATCYLALQCTARLTIALPHREQTPLHRSRAGRRENSGTGRCETRTGR